MTRRRTLGMMSVGLTAFVAASSAGMPPAVLPELPPAGTTVTTVVLPVAPPRGSGTAPLVPVFPSPPPLPVAPPAHTPERPAVRRAPVVRPVEVDITEPVTTVHRFEGRYLGGDKSRTLLYRATGPDTAEIQSCPLANPIPAADTEAKDDVRRIEVPAGAAVWHGGRVFLTTKRELLVIDSECRTDWKFTLPGRPDNGERLLGVAGFDGNKAVVASHHDPKAGSGEKPSGHVLTLDVATGRQFDLATITGGFGGSDKLFVDERSHGLVVIRGGMVYACYPVGRHQDWNQPVQTPAAHVTVAHGTVFVGTVTAITATDPSGSRTLLGQTAATAPLAVQIEKESDIARVFAPFKAQAGHFALASINLNASGHQPPLLWIARTPGEVTVAPIARRQSVYFVAGNAVYRLNAADGAVCWKQTVSLKPGEALNELTFTDGELRASGPGVLVRVAERAEPRLRDLFRFGSER